MTSNFGEKNGAWFKRTNGQRLKLAISGANHADLDWRQAEVDKSELCTLTLYLKTIADSVAERMFEWGEQKTSSRKTE